ncbi:ribonuclease III domain-containing protein, partial [Ampelomyces quisqualis]
MKATPPARYYDLLDATARVGALEVRLGYTFKNRLTCIAALKLFNNGGPLYYDGITHAVDKNNRLALLGDRVLSLVVCEIWFKTEHSNTNTIAEEHSIMSSDTVSRIALEATGNALGLRKSILVPNVPLGPTQTNFTRDHIAETLEAVLGAIYVDSGYNLQAVSNVLKGLGL